jgi:peptidoglycan-N-acetylglucosamine deacetylase
MTTIKNILRAIVPGWIVSWNLDTHERQVALTFDDGPHPLHTPKIIDILKNENIRATFFMLGEHMERYRDIVSLVSEHGHVIANHGYSHQVITKHLLDEEIARTERVIVEITGTSARLFRPPYGALNPAVLLYAVKRNLRTVLWSLDSRDYQDKACQDLISNVRGIKSGDIVLLHDDYAHTVEALPRLIGDIKAKGFGFTAITGSRMR